VLVLLTVVDAAGEPVAPVKLQATLATLVYVGGGGAGGGAPEWRVRVLQQRLQVGDATFVPQTLFGGADAPPEAAAGAAAAAAAAAKAAVAEAGAECVVCLEAPRTTAILPCRHLCLCADCATQLCASANRCPVCRGDVGSLLSVAR